MTTYYHFARIDDDGVPRLTNGDGREIVVGETLTVEGPVELCEHGLHASRHVLDALQYAPPRTVLCMVELGGEIVRGDDKSAASERRCVAMLTEDATNDLLYAFARWCALSVAHLWQTPMPDVVRAYLEGGDESLRAAARAAAWAAAWDAASDASWAASWAAAKFAVNAAASVAAYTASDIGGDTLRARLGEMARAAFVEQANSEAGINPRG